MTRWPVTISLPHGFIVGGVTTWAVELAEGLAARGWPVRVVAHPPRQGYALFTPEWRWPGAPQIVNAPALDTPESVWNALQCYRAQLPTILLPNLEPESYAIAAALAAGHADELRVLAWSHSDNPYDHALLSYYAPAVHVWVTLTQRCTAALATRVGARTDDVLTLPGGVPLPPPVKHPPLQDRPLRLVYGGRMSQIDKRVFDLLELAEALAAREVWAELRLVGDGPDLELLRGRVSHMQTPGERGVSVRLEPPVAPAAMRAVWGWADVALLVSPREGLSLAGLEALACGCVPVISQCGSGVGDLIEEGRNGFTFPVGDVPALTERIAWLAANSDALPSLSRAARTTAEEHGSFTRYLDHVEATLERLARTTPRPWPADRPMLMRAAPAGEDHGTVPADAAERLRRVLQQITATGAGPIALFGAGHHTRALAAVLADCDAEIRAVLDDDPRQQGRQLWGWPVLAPEQAAGAGVRAVVISSWLHESDIGRRWTGPLEAEGLSVWRLYTSAAERATVAAG